MSHFEVADKYQLFARRVSRYGRVFCRIYICRAFSIDSPDRFLGKLKSPRREYRVCGNDSSIKSEETNKGQDGGHRAVSFKVVLEKISRLAEYMFRLL